MAKVTHNALKKGVTITPKEECVVNVFNFHNDFNGRCEIGTDFVFSNITFNKGEVYEIGRKKDSGYVLRRNDSDYIMLFQDIKSHFTITE